MHEEQQWRQTAPSLICRSAPSDRVRTHNEAHNHSVLTSWAIPISKHHTDGESNTSPSALGDSNQNQTVWFHSLALLANRAEALGFLPGRSEFVDLGCGLGFATLYAVEVLGFAQALGIEYDASSVSEGRALIRKAAISTSVKKKISIKQADCASYLIPPRRTMNRVFFIFNPFGTLTLEAFTRNNIDNFTECDVFALANDVNSLPALIRFLPDSVWVRNSQANCSLVFPRGTSGKDCSGN